MLPHAVDEVEELASNSEVMSLAARQGWNIQQWHLTDEDIDRVVAAYQALLAGPLDDEIDELLADLGIDRLGPPASTDQHAKVMRADAMELVAAATALVCDDAETHELHMPNVPKMAGQKSDSGIDIIGVRLDPDASGDITQDERLLLISVKHTIKKYASDMRGKLERSVTDELTGPYLHRQLTTVHGRLIQEGVPEETAKRVMYFLRQTLEHPQVRIVCAGAAHPPTDCNLPDQPDALSRTTAPDAHFRMLLVPNLATLHKRLVPHE